MCCIDSTTGTIPGSLVMSMCWICAPRNFFLAARPVVFAFMGFLLAIGFNLLSTSGRVHRAKLQNEKSHRGLLRCSSREEPAIAGRGGFFASRIFIDYTIESRDRSF